MVPIKGAYVWSPATVRIPSPENGLTELVLPDRAFTVVPNGLLAALDRVAKDGQIRMDPFKDDDRDSMRVAVLELLSAGFLLPVDELGAILWNRLGGAEVRTRKLGPLVMVTNACNLRCPYCCEATETRPGPRFMSLDTAGRAARLLSRHDRPANVTITGGEPFCHPDIFAILSLFAAFVDSVALNTNGTLIETRAQVEEICRYVDLVTVSLDGHTAELHDRYRGKGSFEKSMRTLRWLSEVQACGIWVRSVRVPELDTDRMAALAAEFGAKYFVNDLSGHGRGRAFLDGFGGAYRPTEKLASQEAELDDQTKSVANFNRWTAIKPPASRAAALDMILEMKTIFARTGAGKDFCARVWSSWLPFDELLCPGIREEVCISTDGSIQPCPDMGHSYYGRTYDIGHVNEGRSLGEMILANPIARQMADYEQRPRCKDCFARYHCLRHCLLTNINDEQCSTIRDYVGRVLWRFDPNADPDANARAMFGDILDTLACETD